MLFRSGLGLAISKNFMKLMGGSISLHSEGVNQGTAVTLSLPLLANQAEPAAEDDKAGAVEQVLVGQQSEG